MHSLTKSYVFNAGVLLMVLLMNLSAYAQRAETIQAQAWGTSTMAGKTFNITMRIESYSTPEEQKALIDAFNSGGHDALVKAVKKMKSRGRVSITGGGVGYEIAYIRSFPTSNGRMIRMLTDRPINIWEARESTRSKDYDLSVIELQLPDAKGKNTGSLVPGGRVKMNKQNQVELETFNASPWRLSGIKER